MSIEPELYSLLNTLAGGHVYPDATPDDPVFPCIVYQQVGGEAYEYLERKLPDHEHSRIQISVWALTRDEVGPIARSVRKAIIENKNFSAAETYGSPAWLYEEALGLYGSRQDFGIWLKVS